MSAVEKFLTEIRNRSAFSLAIDAGVSSPDRTDSLGAEFLDSVRDDFVTAVEEGRIFWEAPDGRDGHQGDDEREERSDVIHQIADSSPESHTYRMWRQFVDLCLWDEDIDDLVSGDTPDMTHMAHMSLFVVAERLLSALCAELDSDCATDDDEEDDDDKDDDDEDDDDEDGSAS